MIESHVEEEVRRFYDRWSPTVFTYCRLYLGDEELAQIATEESFVEFLRQSAPVSDDHFPIPLLRSALVSSQRRCAMRSKRTDRDGLRDVLPCVPCEERSVFILRSALDLNMADVTRICKLDSEHAERLWLQAMLSVRRLLLDK